MSKTCGNTVLSLVVPALTDEITLVVQFPIFGFGLVLHFESLVVRNPFNGYKVFCESFIPGEKDPGKSA